MTEFENRNYPNVGQSFGIVGIMIMGMILFSPLILLNKFIDKEALTLICNILAVGITFWIVYSIRKRKTNIKTFHFKINNKRTIPLVIVAMIALYFGIIGPIISLIPVPEFLKQIFIDLAKQTNVFSFISMVIVAPIFEELIFRGIMLDGLLKKYSPKKSILISSILFGLVHLNPWQFIGALIIGVFIGWVYYHSKSISLAIIIHAANNLRGYIEMRLTDYDSSSMSETLVDSYGGILNFVLVITISLLVIATCVYYLNNEFKKMKIEVQSDNELQLDGVMDNVQHFDSNV